MASVLRFSFVLGFLLQTFWQPAVAWASSCDELLTPESHFNLAEEAKANVSYAQNLYKQFQERSSILLSSLKSAEESGEYKVFDTIGIGAGPHNACLLAALKAADPGAKSLVIESSDSLGTFQKLGKTFRLNTPEHGNVSGNVFPAIPAQVSDFNPAGKVFVEGEAVGDATLGAYQYADAPIVFGEKVTLIEKTESGLPARYRLTTQSGVHVYANSVSIATGLGTPAIRITDPATLALIRSETAEAAISPIATVDDFLKNLDKASSLAPQSIPDLSQEEVVVVGAGDGGNIAVEAGGGLAQGLPSSVNEKLKAKKIVWIGQKAKNAKEFISTLNERKAHRYGDIAELYENGKIDPREGRLETVEKITVSGRPRFKISFSSPTGDKTQMVVDRVIFSTGYQNESPQLLSGLGTQTTLKPVLGSIDKKTVPIGDQVFVGGKPENIWIVGNASSVQPTKEEWDHAVGGYMDILLPRSSELGRQIGTDLASLAHDDPASVAPHILHSVSGTSYVFKVEESVLGNASSPSIAEAKISFARLLRN
jgi:thioredoxin reductase